MIMTNDFAGRAGRALLTTSLCLAAALTAGTGVAAALEGSQPSSAATSASPAIPSSALGTLALIDNGQWPPNDGSGTKGGTTFPNAAGALPAADADENPISYLVWDADRKQPGQPRDPQRIVTGSDGSAWYSPDNGLTFAQMR